jgi:crossover junction endodeoxyribonuclease RusA
MIVTLPLPPTANLYWRIWRGRAVMSNEARAYKMNASLAAKAQGLRPIIDAEVAVVLRIFRPARRGDLDNRIKVLLDALRGVAYRDDAQVAALYAVQAHDPENPRVEVEIAPLSPDARPLFRAHHSAKVRRAKQRQADPAQSPGPLILSANWKPV